jgi:FdhD protein
MDAPIQRLAQPLAQGSASVEIPVTRIGKAGGPWDCIAVEVPVAFVYNGEAHAVMMASPNDLTDFAYGFSIAEGIVDRMADIGSVSTEKHGPGASIVIEISDGHAALLNGRKRNIAGRTGCGLCGVSEMDQVLRPLPRLPDSQPIRREAIDRAIRELPDHQQINRTTGAVHAAGFADRDGKLLFVREDVGRHNALDKLIGAVSRAGLNPDGGFVLTTSRCSMEMVQKTVSFGSPVLVTVSAPTSLAIELAEQHNLSVAAFARGAGCNLYTHSKRII